MQNQSFIYPEVFGDVARGMKTFRLAILRFEGDNSCKSTLKMFNPIFNYIFIKSFELPHIEKGSFNKGFVKMNGYFS
jgi:extradiol dioxygenase family protein